MRGETVLRLGLEADHPALLNLWVAAWSAAMPAIDFEARRNWMAERLLTLSQEGAVLLVAEHQNIKAPDYLASPQPSRHCEEPEATRQSSVSSRSSLDCFAPLAMTNAADSFMPPPPALAGFITVHPKTGYLDQIAVHPAHQGQGIAHMLLKEAKALSPQKIELHVNQNNPRAIGFYEREGFVRLGEGVNPLSQQPVFHYGWSG